MRDSALVGKTVIITGAGRGLGAAHARACADSGAAVVLVDIDQDGIDAVAGEITADGGQAVALLADITDWETCARAVESTVDSFGRVDGLVNNAAINQLSPPLEETESEIRRHYEVNVLGTFFMSIHAARAMQGRGSIVNVTSGAHSGMRFSGKYGSTKGAVASLTYCWANDFKAAGSAIRVNALSPHAQTPMMDDAAKYYRANFGAGLRFHAPDPSTNSPVVVYLLSDSSAHVTGQVVRIEDGQRLSIGTHPAMLAPPLYRESWTIDEIAAAFDAKLDRQLQPVGLAYLDAHPVDRPIHLPVFETGPAAEQ